jgi:hypothetical protein
MTGSAPSGPKRRDRAIHDRLFYGGSQWSFCCNTQQSTLGGYDNTFSSIQRT